MPAIEAPTFSTATYAADDLRRHAAVTDTAPTPGQRRVLHQTIRAVTEDFDALRFNTAISRLMEFVNCFTGQPVRPRPCMEPFVLMRAPLAPHIAEEIWQALGHRESLTHEPWPAFDERFVREETIELPVQINGKVRSRITIVAEAMITAIEHAALADARVQAALAGKPPREIIVVPKKLVNIVV